MTSPLLVTNPDSAAASLNRLVELVLDEQQATRLNFTPGQTQPLDVAEFNFTQIRELVKTINSAVHPTTGVTMDQIKSCIELEVPAMEARITEVAGNLLTTQNKLEDLLGRIDRQLQEIREYGQKATSDNEARANELLQTIRASHDSQRDQMNTQHADLLRTATSKFGELQTQHQDIVLQAKRTFEEHDRVIKDIMALHVSAVAFPNISDHLAKIIADGNAEAIG